MSSGICETTNCWKLAAIFAPTCRMFPGSFSFQNSTSPSRVCRIASEPSSGTVKMKSVPLTPQTAAPPSTR